MLQSNKPATRKDIVVQDAVGLVVFVLVLVISGNTAHSTNKNGGAGSLLLKFIGMIIFCYVVLGIFLGVIYLFAWFGIFIRDVLMWFIEAVLKPYDWVIPD